MSTALCGRNSIRCTQKARKNGQKYGVGWRITRSELRRLAVGGDDFVKQMRLLIIAILAVPVAPAQYDARDSDSDVMFDDNDDYDDRPKSIEVHTPTIIFAITVSG
jgi:hypothetical protein